MTALTWTLCDAEQTVLATLSDRAASSVTISRNAARTATVNLDLADDAVPLVSPASTLLKATVDGWSEPLFIGRVQTKRIVLDEDEESCEITAADPWEHFSKVWLAWFSTGLAPDSYAYYMTGADWGTLVPLWLSDTADRGHGVVPGSIASGHAPESAIIPTFSPLSDAFSSILELDNMPEFWLTPVEETDGTLAEMNVAARQGSDKTATITLKCGSGDGDHLLDATYDPSTTDMVNRHVAIGDVIATSEVAGYTYQHHVASIAWCPDSMTEYGTWESSSSHSGVTGWSTLVAYAYDVVRANGAPGGAVEGTLDPDSEFTFGPDGDFWVGDSVTVAIHAPSGTVTIEQRVSDVVIEEGDAGDLEVTLGLEQLPVDSGDISSTFLTYVVVDSPEAPTAPVGGGTKPSTPTKKKKRKKKKRKKKKNPGGPSGLGGAPDNVV